MELLYLFLWISHPIAVTRPTAECTELLHEAFGEKSENSKFLNVWYGSRFAFNTNERQFAERL